MPNIGAVIREEIQRLARRVSRQMNARLKSDVVALKRQSAAHKKILTQLRRDNSKLIADLKARLAAPPAAHEKEWEHARLSPRNIRSQRARLGLPREAIARLVGVSAGAVQTWEGGQSKPGDQARAALVAIRRIGKRDARWRLETLGRSGHKAAARPVAPAQKRSTVRRKK
jgi:DNA-binding transcriptional regulator YiaG